MIVVEPDRKRHCEDMIWGPLASIILEGEIQLDFGDLRRHWRDQPHARTLSAVQQMRLGRSDGLSHTVQSNDWLRVSI
jgi:hypothetical protein